MKTRDYPGHELSKKELLNRISAAYQLAGRLLLGPNDPKEVRSEMDIVLLDFLSDPTTADVDRLRFAARGFAPFHHTTVTSSAASDTMNIVEEPRRLA